MQKPHENNIHAAQKNLEKFEEHLISYHSEQNHEKRDTLERYLDDTLLVIKADLEIIGKRGTHKEIGQIVKEYEAFKQSNSDNDYAALGQDLQTVKQFLNEIG